MIVAHDDDYDVFQRVLNDSLQHIQNDANNRTNYYLGRGGVDLEQDVFETVLEKARGSKFENNIELVSGQKFPDIVAYVNKQKAFGLEVKTTKSNKWKSTGSSIFEGTRVADVKNIHLLFGKLAAPVEFKCRPYEDCLYDVAVTHSPRYLIDMDTTNSIFHKIGIDYNSLRQLDNPFSPIKTHFRKTLPHGEDIWWIDNNDDNFTKMNIGLWCNLSADEKHDLRIKAFAYFPNIISNDSKKYLNLATWLVSRYGIVNHALRDTFSAGGLVLINDKSFPKIFKYLIDDTDNIYETIRSMSIEDIEHYWQVDLLGRDPISVWKDRIIYYCATNTRFSAAKTQIIANLLGKVF